MGDDAGLTRVFKRQSSEDYVEYFIFLPRNSFPSSDEALAEIRAMIQLLTGNYLWQKDGISVKLTNLKDIDDEDEGLDDDLVCLHGVTRVGENIEDVWFVTWVMLQLTTKFPHAVVRVIDNDGEFLLIEAADHLPEWAESDEVCQKRVYLHNGKVHLIPRLDDPSKNIQVKSPPRMTTAVQVVRSHPDITVASDSIQNCIQSRLAKFPLKEEEFMHVNLMLPVKVAAVLKQQPELVAPAVEAFYYREPIELSAARLMKNFKPAEGLIKTRVRFTKFLYAMLSKQEYRPDAKCGWIFPKPTAADFKAHSLGAKLTIGFEILLTRVKSSFISPSTDDLQTSAEYLMYVDKLEKMGYFQEYLKGSKPYQELEAKARQYYVNSVATEGKSGSGLTTEQKLRELVDTVQVDSKVLEAEATNLPPDDDDSWINITPENLESVLERQFGGSLNQAVERPEDIPQKLKEFMSKMAELEGVDLPVSPRSQHEDKSEHSVSSDGMLEPMDFRADDFVSAMDKLLADLGKPDKDWEESEDSYSEGEDEAMAEIMKKHTFAPDSKLHQLMNQMDAELAGTDVAKSCTEEGDHEEFDDVESFEPVDIDTAALKNMLKSFQSQEFPTGPSTNLLRSVCFDISRAAGASSSSSASQSEVKKKPDGGK